MPCLLNRLVRATANGFRVVAPSDRPRFCYREAMSDESSASDVRLTDDEAAGLVGKTVLIGLTYVEPGTEDAYFHGQFFGMIEAADSGHVVIRSKSRLWHGQLVGVPPQRDILLKPAKPGKYRLRLTGEVVVDPDIVGSATLEWPREDAYRGAPSVPPTS
jgi:hypothetical protein